MNTQLSTTLPKPKIFLHLLVALAVVMVIYSTVIAGNLAFAQVSLPGVTAQINPDETLHPSDFPVPSPVPTPPATRSQATATPAIQLTAPATPVPVPQAVPTPPAMP